MAAASKAPSLFREELRRAWYELRGTRATPARAAAAVALGLFVGSIPAYGTHTPIVLAICLLLQLDALVAWLASNISNPFFSPFLLTAEVQIGAYVHTRAPLPLHELDSALATGLSGVLLYLFTGALIVATGLALVGGAVAFTVLRLKRQVAPAEVRPSYRLPDNAPAWWVATERVAMRYTPIRDRSTPAQRSRFHYVRVKMLGDPVAQLIAQQAPEGGFGEVLDVGAGRGQLALALLELGLCERVHGVDWDAAKIDSARAAAAVEPALDATFEVGDVRETLLPPADAVMLIDVVHYLSLAEQDALVSRAARAVRPGGMLLLREADTARGWRSFMTLCEEKLFTLLRFNRGARVKFRPAGELRGLLEKEGLACQVLPAWGKTPFSNVLIVGTRT